MDSMSERVGGVNGRHSRLDIWGSSGGVTLGMGADVVKWDIE
jgi:hypothetical protein